MVGFTRDREVTSHRLGRDVLRRILGFARPYRTSLGVFLAVIAVEAGLGALTPLLFRVLVDDGITAGSSRTVVLAAVGVATLALVGAGLSFVNRWLSARIGEGLIRDLRVQVFDHVQRMPLAFFSRAKTGALVQRLNGDVLGAQQAFTSTLQNVVSNSLTVVFVLAAMASMSWQLTLLSLVMVPVFIGPARWFGRKMAAVTRESYDLNAAAAQTMTERFNVAGAHLVKVFGTPAREAADYGAQADAVARIGVRRALYATWFRVGLTTLAALAVAVVYGVGGVQAVRGQLTVGVVVALTAYLQRLYGPLTALSNVQVDVMTALVSFERVLEVLDLEPSVADAPDAHDLRDDVAAQGASLELAGVGFRYPEPDEVSLASLEQAAALPGATNGAANGATNSAATSAANSAANSAADGAADGAAGDTVVDVSFAVPAGSMVALVGPSGAGKTTLSQLVTRMYDPTSGAVRIAGTDLRQVTQESLHAIVGVVSQEAHLFHDTVAGNLRYARPEATDDELWTVLRAARIADLVAAMPQGLDTVVGDRGYRLSGGERQRLAIARVLLKSPALVVLDEATAHLDSESEAAVQAALDAALTGRTALVIAHRLSTVRHADLIVVVDDGRVVEQGTHTDLLAADGLYADLYRTQFAPAG
jgi:ATP-binding cassette subfamily B protein